MKYLVLIFLCMGLFVKAEKPIPDPKPRIVFLVSKDPLNYEAHLTIPRYAENLKKNGHFKVKVLESKGDRRQAHIPNINAIKKADLLVVFCRRLALKPAQIEVLKNHVRQGKPVVGIRTSSHGFSIRDSMVEGYVDWWDFVPDVLGAENRGYEPEELGSKIDVVEANKDHQILKGITIEGWKSNGQVYKVAPLIDQSATVLLTGSTVNVTEPFAWTRTTQYGGNVFYTTLGYPDDFDNPKYVTLLTNGIKWALDK